MELSFTEIAKAIKRVFWEEKELKTYSLRHLSLLCLVEIQMEMSNEELCPQNSGILGKLVGVVTWELSVYDMLSSFMVTFS